MEDSVQLNVKKKERILTPSFLLLWQGQFVSGIGDMVYEIALGFWVLAVTNSPKIMGYLMAASMLPRILVSPFAGVVVDRANRKRILIIMDAIRGIFVVGVAAAAFTGVIKIWMVFAAGIVIGLCGSFFSPAVSSSIPDIVPKSGIVKANSLFSMIYAATNILGSSAGGFLYMILGAPLMFLVNGISYLVSSFSMLFMKIPRTEKEKDNVHFFTDMKEGFKFVWKFKGLKNLIFIAAFVNFFATAAMVLFMPYFKSVAWLGPGKYGIAMAAMGIGSLLGMVFTSVYNIKAEKRMSIFYVSALMMSVLFALLPILKNFIIMILLIILGGICNAVINVLIQASVQLTVPAEMRGKIFSILGTVMMGLSPIAMAVGGNLTAFFPIKSIITACFLITLVMFVPYGFMPSFKKFINYNPETQNLEDII